MSCQLFPENRSPRSVHEEYITKTAKISLDFVVVFHKYSFPSTNTQKYIVIRKLLEFLPARLVKTHLSPPIKHTFRSLLKPRGCYSPTSVAFAKGHLSWSAYALLFVPHLREFFLVRTAIYSSTRLSIFHTVRSL